MASFRDTINKKVVETMYTSTRKKISVHASHAILKGLSDEGGLFVLDALDDRFYQHASFQTYQHLAKDVFSYFLDDFTEDMVSNIVEKSYGKQFQPHMYTTHTHENVSFLNLYHGPTFAFKDIALQALPHMITYSREIQNVSGKTIILTATSGDTGGASLAGFSQLKDVLMIVLYPKLGVSAFQERQMNQYQSESCLIYGVDGNFDDCQRIVKELLKNVTLNHVQISSANSINIGRIISQVVYYMHGYKRLVLEGVIKEGDLLDVIVPSGNFGNIYAAYLSKKLGTPIGELVVASNKNNTLTKLFNTKTYQVNQTLYQTMSPSMDILVSSNIERYVYDVLKNPSQVKEVYETFEKNKDVTLDALHRQHDFIAYETSEEETKNAIQMCYQQTQHIIDPHTAVAYHVYVKHHQKLSTNHAMIVSTASPYKFSEHVLTSLDQNAYFQIGDNIDALKAMDQKPMDARIEAVLKSSSKEMVLSLEAAYHTIKKVMESYDRSH